MSIFRNRSHTDLSALVDDELGPRSARDLRASLDAGHTSRDEYDRIRAVSQIVRVHRMDADVDAAERRVRARLERSLAGAWGAPRRLWWERTVSLPMPVVATAALVLLFFAVAVVDRFPGTHSAAAGVPQIAGNAETLNLQVNVNASQTEDLLRWLNDQNSLETVTIRLPDSAQFQLRGEPVIMRPGLPGETDATDEGDAEPVLTPLPIPTEEGVPE